MAANSKASSVRTYASLLIAYDGGLDEAVTLLKSFGLPETEYVDNSVPRRQQLLTSLRSKGVGLTAKPLRHNWRVCSQHHVKKNELEPHLLWLFEQIKPKKRLSALETKGFRVQVSCFWETSDFGGGPVITRNVSRLLQYHQIPLVIDIYPGSTI